MANVYSAALWIEPGVSTLIAESSAVPAGYVWVVRDIVFGLNTPWDETSQGFSVGIHDGSADTVIFAVQTPFATGQAVYHWTGHQVMNAGDYLIGAAGDMEWWIRVSGYVLTLP